MKSIFYKEVREEVKSRIDLLTSENKAGWGKMNVSQMVKHCVLCEEYYHGNVAVKRAFLGRIFGKTAIKGILKNGLQKNAPTSPQFKIADSAADFETEKSKWKNLIDKYAQYKNESFLHWFFGNMTKKQLGEFIYQHCDHHLRQFWV